MTVNVWRKSTLVWVSARSKLVMVWVNCSLLSQLVQMASIHNAPSGEHNKLLFYRQQSMTLSIFSLGSKNRTLYIHTYINFRDNLDSFLLIKIFSRQTKQWICLRLDALNIFNWMVLKQNKIFSNQAIFLITLLYFFTSSSKKQTSVHLYKKWR